MPSHYDYLKKHLPAFFAKAGVSWDDNAGIIAAHGDKCYGYQTKWEAANIPFEKGVAIYLLSYCAPYSNTCREVRDGYQFNHKWVDPGNWVIDNWNKFKDWLP